MSKPINISDNLSESLKDQIKAISDLNEYNYTYTKVYTNSAAPIDEGINITKGEEIKLFKDSSETLEYCKTPIVIDIMDKNKTKNVGLVVSDILKLIGSNHTFSGLAINSEYINTESDVTDQQGNLIATRRINIEVFYKKNIWST